MSIIWTPYVDTFSTFELLGKCKFIVRFVDILRPLNMQHIERGTVFMTIGALFCKKRLKP